MLANDSRQYFWLAQSKLIFVWLAGNPLIEKCISSTCVHYCAKWKENRKLIVWDESKRFFSFFHVAGGCNLCFFPFYDGCDAPKMEIPRLWAIAFLCFSLLLLASFQNCLLRGPWDQKWQGLPSQRVLRTKRSQALNGDIF